MKFLQTGNWEHMHGHRKGWGLNKAFLQGWVKFGHEGIQEGVVNGAEGAYFQGKEEYKGSIGQRRYLDGVWVGLNTLPAQETEGMEEVVWLPLPVPRLSSRSISWGYLSAGVTSAE